jgi:hypothetical protein
MSKMAVLKGLNLQAPILLASRPNKDNTTCLRSCAIESTKFPTVHKTRTLHLSC